MLEILSNKLVGIFIKNEIISTDETDDFLYGMELLLLFILDFSIIFTIGLVTGYLGEIFFFTLGFTPLKLYAGGYHASTPLRCLSLYLVIVFVLIYLGSLLANYQYHWLLLATLLGISFGLLYKFSPVESKSKPLSGDQKKHSRQCTFLIFSFQVALIALMLSLHMNSTWIVMMTFGIAVESGTLFQ